KIDLHCHLDGSVRVETMLDIAIKENLGLWLRAHVIGLFENYLGAELISSICIYTIRESARVTTL
ncbi:hypothetical protein QMU_0527, partial [Clostridioides difficile DA00310]